MRYTINAKTGQRKEGKAAPKLLREDLRVLPSEIVTNEIEEESKVHELDAPHIRDSFLEDFVEEAEGKTPEKQLTTDDVAPKLPEKKIRKISQASQFDVDLIRLRVMKACLDTEKIRVRRGLPLDLGKRYLWFPEDNLDYYCLRRGNPPAPQDRPGYLKHKELHIDLEVLPKRIADYSNRLQAEKLVNAFTANPYLFSSRFH